MRPQPIILILGTLILSLGLIMLVPAFLDLAYGRPEWETFIISSLVTAGLGVSLVLAIPHRTFSITLREAFLVTVLAWIILTGFSALPLYWSPAVDNFTDAFFESMSGLTTTGATVIATLEDLSPGVLLWRSILQWLGGLGIVVIAIGLFPLLQIGGMQLFKAEGFETIDKILPSSTQIAIRILLIYVALTLMCMLSYWSVGMPFLEALMHAMTTIATGGFSPKDASIGHYNNPAVEVVAILFMSLSSLPFIVFVQMMGGKISVLFKDSQSRFFIGLGLGAVLLIWLMHEPITEQSALASLRHVAFNTVSAFTGTGYASGNYELWGSFSVSLLIMLMLIGGCTGSASCGLKIFRLQIILKAFRLHLKYMLYPSGVFRERYYNKPLGGDIIRSVTVFFFVYVFSVFVLSILLEISGLDNWTAFSAAVSAIANIGPGFGSLIGPTGNFESLNNTAKWLFSFGMLVGRLEILAVFVLFLPRFWRT